MAESNPTQERVVERFADAGRFTPEVIAAVRARLGYEKQVQRGWCTEVTRDGIRHWADGLGDDNPLWSVADSGKHSCWGEVIPPPSWYMTTIQGPRHRASPEKSTGGGMPGIHGVWVEEEWEWFGTGRVGEPITAYQTYIAGVTEKMSGFGGMVLETVSTHRVYSGGRLVARQRDKFIRHDRKQATEKGKYSQYEKYRWSEDELKAWSDAIEAEHRRGADPRYWEDTNIGDVIPPVHKGPLTGTEMTTFVQGWGGPFIMASQILHRYLRRHPALNVRDRFTNVPDVPERAHWEEEYAREAGFPTGYDFGGQRYAWMTTCVTDWMGDAAFLKKLRTRFQRLNLLGDGTTISGQVTGKRIEGEHGYVDFELAAVNQRGETTVLARGEVILPRKGQKLPVVGWDGLPDSV